MGQGQPNSLAIFAFVVAGSKQQLTRINGNLLERDNLPTETIQCAIYHAHAASPKLVEQLVALCDLCRCNGVSHDECSVQRSKRGSNHIYAGVFNVGCSTSRTNNIIIRNRVALILNAFDP